MKLRYLRAFIVLLAGLITLIVNIKTHKDVTVSLVILLIVILLFYLMATVVVEILQRSLEQKDEEIESKDSQLQEEEENTEQDEMVQVPFEEEE